MAEPPDDDVTPAALRRLFLIATLPLLGVVVFAVAGALALRAFAHNNSGACGDASFAREAASLCTHYSYALPVVVGIAGIVLVMAGGAYASYYAARHVGLPLLTAFRRRHETDAADGPHLG